ncbi:MAG: Lrp/AsnC family transcriptional regulator [Candidatus Aenigmarchaeota archaeon]|nr:Lrp/AsnC family transcriptional regulator [Candidatus Aenigmarchaeota archaeon]
MDDIDTKLLGMLKKDSRRSFVTMAEQLGVTEGTVRNRVKEMMQAGEIKRFTIKTKAGMEALVFVKAQRTNLRGIVQELEKIADDLYEISGDYDIVVRIEADSLKGLNEKVDSIREIKGIAATSTAVKLAQK